ncbi:hypothetical protein [Acidithiobacillus caldus]|uniref:hypothetical protein n=1 Tax=Acidithiobacillus caldus TaxID=33059 RepID=UPI001F518BF7|nr:hypothetical protein [Acidithiobacillus caldus]
MDDGRAGHHQGDDGYQSLIAKALEKDGGVEGAVAHPHGQQGEEQGDDHQDPEARGGHRNVLPAVGDQRQEGDDHDRNGVDARGIDGHQESLRLGSGMTRR